jgi:hypothetical protein
MKENAILRRRFNQKGFDMISEFIRSIKSEVTQESWGKVLYRDKTVSTELFLRMASELGCSKKEIHRMLLARGEKAIAKLIGE